MLRSILTMVGQDVTGLVVDIRTRNADGSLRYEHLEKNTDYARKLIKVCFKREKLHAKDAEKADWLYWYWEKGTHEFDCGFSGCANREEWPQYYLEVLDNEMP